MDQVTCPAAFQSRRRIIHNKANTKASSDERKISSTLPNVSTAIMFPIRITTTSQSSERIGSLRRKRDPTSSVPNRLIANQTAARYKNRTSILLGWEKTDQQEPANRDRHQPDDH